MEASLSLASGLDVEHDGNAEDDGKLADPSEKPTMIVEYLEGGFLEIAGIPMCLGELVIQSSHVGEESAGK